MIEMEDHFSPGFRSSPAVHVGSQTMSFYRGVPEHQAWEHVQLAAAFAGDVAVVRNLEPAYRAYWEQLAGSPAFVEVEGKDPGEFLTRELLDEPRAIAAIKARMRTGSSLSVFFPTELEARLADVLEIPLHGSPEISARYGTKSGVRSLAQQASVPMPPGVVCRSLAEVVEALVEVGRDFDEIIVKHDLATGGLYSRRLVQARREELRDVLDDLSDGTFEDGRDTVVVEGWVRSSAVLCAHIEILPGSDPVLCAGWQQIMAEDGTTHIGSGPLTISPTALSAFKAQLSSLARCLKEQGATGSFGPDFLVVGDDEDMGPGTVLLLELNARAPATAYALEIVRRVRGAIGHGFFSRHVSVPIPTTFAEVATMLDSIGLLIRRPSSGARGVVPYNVGLLPWGVFDVVAMADTWEEAALIMRQVQTALSP